MPLGKFTAKAQAALERAQQMALERNQGEMRALHLLYVLLDEEDSSVKEILEKELNVDVRSMLKDILEEIIKLPRIFTAGGGFAQMYLAQEVIQLIEAGVRKAVADGNKYISPEYIFFGILSTKNSAQDILNKYNLDKEKYLDSLYKYTQGQKVTEEFQEIGKSSLEKYSRDLTQLAQENKLDPVIGREKELRRVMEILCRRTKNNPILIGEAGVGKTAIVEGLAQAIAHKEVLEALYDKKIISLDLGSLIAGTRFRGEFEERLKNLLKEIKKEGNIILFIDEVHTLVGAGAAEGAMDASNLLKPALSRGELRAIGTATFRDYREYIEKDPALERRFQPVTVEEPSIEETIAILRGLKERYEAHHGLKISDEALIVSVHLSSRYITSRFLPDKAIDLVDEAASALSLEAGSIPLPLAELGREIKSTELEKEAIKKEEGKKAKAHQRDVEKRLKKLKKEYDNLNKRWRKEKDIFDAISEIKKKIAEANKQAQEEERKGNLEKVAEIIYSYIPKLNKQLQVKGRSLNRIPQKSKFLKDEVGTEDIARVVSRWTGIPVTKMLEKESEKLNRIEKELSTRVIGQKEAIHAVSRAIKRTRAGISEVDKPIGSFIFLGPTGVGKTELARALAEFIFSDEKAMIRIDMSEYMEKHSTARLIGSPPGYVGYEEGGQLTEAIKHRPYSLILFDEIEKAHPEVFNLFLQVLDNGRLTDGKGRTVDFKNTIVIMTSNLGGEYVREISSIGFVPDKDSSLQRKKGELKEKIEEQLRVRFRPEFLNRIDDIVIFNSLTHQDIEKIVDIQIERIEKRLAEKGIIIKLTEEAKKYLAQKGYNPEFGARPLKRLMEKEVLDPLADKIISGKIKQGAKIRIGFKNKGLIFEKGK